MLGESLMTPFGGMNFVSLNCAMVRIDAGELHVFAEIIATVLAEEAFTAWNAGLDGYAVTYIRL